MAQRRPTSSRVSERARDHRAWRATPDLPSARRPYPQASTPLPTPPFIPSFAATTFSASAFSCFLHLHCRRRRRCRRIRLLYIPLLLLLRCVLAAPFGPLLLRSFVRSYVRVSPAERARAECSPTSARPVSKNIRLAPSSFASVSFSPENRARSSRSARTGHREPPIYPRASSPFALFRFGS